MSSQPPPWIYRLAAIAVCIGAALASSGGAVPLRPSVLLVLALAWAHAAGGGGEQDGATWSATVKRLLGPTVLPFYLCIAVAVVFAGTSNRKGDPGCGAMACGVCGTVGAPVPAPASASASVAAAPSMCGGSKGGCGASGGGACGCGGGGHGAGSKAQSGSACGCGAGNKAPSAPRGAQVEPRKNRIASGGATLGPSQTRASATRVERPDDAGPARTELARHQPHRPATAPRLETQPQRTAASRREAFTSNGSRSTFRR